MNSTTSVVIVGAGPYGLSLAAHLSARSVPFRIFGPAMEGWRDHMPEGMCLKSDGFASDLYDPERSFTLRRFCAEQKIPYEEYGLPVHLETFVNYGLAFQKALVPTLTEQWVTRISRVAGEFRVETTGNESITAQQVVIATGLSNYARIPAPLDTLPASVCTHSSAHHHLSPFAGKRVLVVGGGAAATDLAALLKGQGTHVELLSRRPVVFHTAGDPKRRTLWKKITEPNLGLGPNFRSAMYTAFPGLFRQLPQHIRHRIVANHLGPAGGWFVRDQVVGKVPMHVGYKLKSAELATDGVHVVCSRGNGEEMTLVVDHVIAATGYDVSVDNLAFLDPALKADIAREGASPTLSAAFESTVPGLFFVGASAAKTFGPVMRFALGAGWAARRVTARAAALYRRRPQPTPVAAPAVR